MNKYFLFLSCVLAVGFGLTVSFSADLMRMVGVL